MAEGGNSMFDTVKDHEDRIGNLERADKEHEERLKRLEDQSIKLENTILAENRDTRTTMKEQTEKLFAIVEKAMGYQSNESEYLHEQKMAKINTWANVFLKVMGGLTAAGGIGYLIVQHFLNQMGGN